MSKVVPEMRVLAVYIEPAPYILDLIRVLREEHPGLQLHVLFITEAATQPWGKMLQLEGIELLPSARMAAMRRIGSLIRQGDFDWLHLAGWGHPLLAMSLLIGSLAGKCKISMESDTQLPFERGGWKQGIKSIVMPGLFSRVDLFLPGGSRQKALLLHYGVPESKIRVAQMTVDVQRIISLTAQIRARREAIRSELGVAETACLFVYVGRLEGYKGIGLLLDAFAQMDGEINLLIVGDGACRGLVEQAASEDERIRYAGRRDFTGVVEALAISDVAVVPSSFEPWGLVVNEAMAAGLPVIASDRVGCVDDLVIDSETGMVIKSGDTEALTAAMCAIAVNESYRRQLGNNAQGVIRQWDLQEESNIICLGWYDAEL